MNSFFDSAFFVKSDTLPTMKQLSFLIGVLCIISMACGPTDNAPKPSVFHYNQHLNVSSLDPAFARAQNNIWAVDHLYNGLVQLTENLEVIPCLAKSYVISEDGLTYTFALHDDVYFKDDACFPEGKGRRMVAKDVLYSFSRIVDDAVGSPGSWIFKGRIAEQMPFSAPNDSTFVLKLASPFRPMLGILTMQYCSVVPQEAVEHYGNTFRQHPVGTGPFQLKTWIEGQALYLEKNDQYFETTADNALPKVDAIRLSFIPDRKTAFLELMKGKIDFMSGLEASYTNELLTNEGQLRSTQAERLQFLKGPYLNMEYLGINVELADSLGSPLSHTKVRQAMNWGFDRQKMLRTLRNGVGFAADAGFIPRGLPAYAPDRVMGYGYDPQRARKLLAEAGFPNGDGLGQITLQTTKEYLDLCTFIVRQWEDLGLQVKIELSESGILRQMMRKSQVEFFRASWIADYPDGESFLTVFYGKHPGQPNYTHFRNKEFDELYEAALLENHDSLRLLYYQNMDRILIEEAPVIFLFYDETALFASKEIIGLEANGINLLKVKQIEKP